MIKIVSSEAVSTNEDRKNWGKRVLVAGVAAAALLLGGAWAGGDIIDNVCDGRGGFSLDAKPESPFCDGVADLRDRIAGGMDAFVPEVGPLFDDSIFFDSPVYDPEAPPVG
jgi:hypothetical protein